MFLERLTLGFAEESGETFVLFKKGTVEEMCSWGYCFFRTPMWKWAVSFPPFRMAFWSREKVDDGISQPLQRGDFPTTWGGLPEFLTKVGNDKRRNLLDNSALNALLEEERPLSRFLSHPQKPRSPDEPLPKGLVEGCQELLKILVPTESPSKEAATMIGSGRSYIRTLVHKITHFGSKSVSSLPDHAA